MKIKAAAVLMLITMLPGSIEAGAVPGRWEKVEALDAGSRVIIFLQQGDRLECSLQGITERSLLVETSEQSEKEIPKPTIKKITGAQAIEDSKRNGTLLGAGIGFGVGFAGMVAWEKAVTASGYELAEENLSLAILGGGVGLAAGALIGRAFDGVTKSYELLYKAP
jgi:hypothetical protein